MVSIGAHPILEEADLIVSLAIAALAASSSLPPLSTRVLPACGTSQVSITFDGENGHFSGMSHAGTLMVVRNIGVDVCRVPALPELRFEDAAHRALSIVRQVPKGMHPGPVILPLGIAPGAEATAELRWVSGDVYDGHHCVTTATAIVQIGTDTYKQAFSGQFCSAANTPATFTQTWLKTDAHL
jgi:hypothetical protein